MRCMTIALEVKIDTYTTSLTGVSQTVEYLWRYSTASYERYCTTCSRWPANQTLVQPEQLMDWPDRLEHYECAPEWHVRRPGRMESPGVAGEFGIPASIWRRTGSLSVHQHHRRCSRAWKSATTELQRFSARVQRAGVGRTSR